MIGHGGASELLDETQVRQIVSQAFNEKRFNGKKILFIIPDHSRTAPIDVLFRALYQELESRIPHLDFLVALGTHPAMSDEAINHRVGITQEERKATYPKARFFNHYWNDPQQLRKIGAISAAEVEDLSSGLMHEPVEVVINKMVFDYDLLVIVGPTFPHEVVGFSGGNKYLFPGIAGQEIIDMFHWLGALITNPGIIGAKYTPVRKVVDKAASLLTVEKLCFSLVVNGNGLAGLYFGAPEQAWEAAAELSDQLHITYKDKPYHTVLSCAPQMYDDLWTGGKCMYKLEPVVADGGTLIIYAPHISEVSVSHGPVIEQVGYHVRDYFVKQWEQFKHFPAGVLAHSTHVKGVGVFEHGVEKPRIHVVLATSIPPQICKKINLGYRDPATIHPQDFLNREQEGILYVPKAGEMLYRLKNDPFKK